MAQGLGSDVAVALYMDVHIPRSVSDGLVRRGVSVLTSQADETQQWSDERILARATELGRVLVTQDEDLLAIANDWQTTGTSFSGVIYAHQLIVSIGVFIADLALIAECGSPEDHTNRVIYLPL